MNKKKKCWQLDETSKHVIRVKLADNRDKILAFRNRWKITGDCPGNRAGFPIWRKKIEIECQDLRREIRVSEVEAYFEASDAVLPQPILSSDIEGRLREENWGNSLEAAFAMEVRALGAELKFPTAWDRVLEYYLLYDEEKFEFVFNHGITLSVRYRINEEYGLIGENVCLTLSENTTSPDLDNFWNNHVKPLLTNLKARIKDRLRNSKNAPLLEVLTERNALKQGWQASWKGEVTGRKLKETDRDIAVEVMDDKSVDRLYHNISHQKEKKINKQLGKKVQNIRYYRSKRHPL